MCFILEPLCGEIALCIFCFSGRLLSLRDMNYQCVSHMMNQSEITFDITSKAVIIKVNELILGG